MWDLELWMYLYIDIQFNTESNKGLLMLSFFYKDIYVLVFHE